MAEVVAVARDAAHRFSKTPCPAIVLIAGEGVEGDAHRGVTVQHRSRVAQDPTQPNLRQVHLLSAELFDELAEKGYEVRPGDMGENITTRGLDLLGLPRGTVLGIGEARLEVTGLRNPCAQISGFRPGLLSEVLRRGPDGTLVRRAGIMAVVTQGGAVSPGDAISVHLPAAPHLPLERV
ncbi:MOSC domain-containing protein [Salipiger sp. P9]|uniref:MOSC domain-containing protein n=1 Tax=Salipiger pentaromativorans TaxID=2943193 RepID=UPI002157FA81|nr:MOSC domain-containing protein [Salipiger pentaromativorans]MCR8546697.1 MOSC domain-containing protein [Salipiger pentaromativorans]